MTAIGTKPRDPAAVSEAPPVRAAALRLLVIDDDDLDRLIVRRNLTRSALDATLDEAAAPDEALARVQAESFDCLLLDYNIPGSDGLTLLRRIRELSPDVPVVMLTGQGDEQVAVQLMKAGAADYLSKGGLSPERLAQSVGNAVELARASRAARVAAARTRRLQEFTQMFAATLDTAAVAELFVTQVRQAMGADTAWIAVHPPGHDAVVKLAAAGLDDLDYSAFDEVPLDAPLPITDVLRDGRSRFFHASTALLADYPELDGKLGDHPPEGFAVLPLDAGDRPFGVVVLGFFEPYVFTDDDRAFALALTRQCAQAMERARLYDAERTARTDAEEANKAKSEFLARMSHDLRTPLNAIGGYAQLMELGVQGPVSDAQKESLGRMRRAQQHLLTLINDILSFAKLEAGQVTVTLEPVAVRGVVEELAELVRPDASARALEVGADVGPAGLTVLADRKRLLQILVNLTSNALKFTDLGHVHISARAEGDHAYLAVRDTGRGIPTARLEAIFDPFVQVKTSDEGRGGVGLGLAISRELARMMGGDLTVASNEGEGSTFTVRLPRA